MNKTALAASLVALALVGLIFWRVAACYIANAELQSDMRFISHQMGTTTGLSDPLTEDQLRDSVIKKAKEDGIELGPSQVSAEKIETLTTSTVNLAVDYDGTIDLFLFVLHPHFSLTSSGTITVG